MGKRKGGGFGNEERWKIGGDETMMVVDQGIPISTGMASIIKGG